MRLSADDTIHARRLALLRWLCREGEREWKIYRTARGVRPMDVGGRNGNSVSPDLLAMSRLGLVKVIPRYVGINAIIGHSGSNRYKITPKGKRLANDRNIH